MLHRIETLSARAALRLVEGVMAHATANGWAVAVAVVDAQGVPLAALRMDGVPPPIVDFAADKAFTAATMRRATAAFAERMLGSDSLRLGFTNRARLAVWGGGLPVVAEGRVVGGIGVSGAQDHEDIACAEAALAALGLGWQP